MMMRMLEAGGLAVHHDGMRRPDESNPRGYFELEAIKRLPEDPGVLRRTRGGAVKVIFALAYHLPTHARHAVILMRRPITEVAASQRRMLERLGRPADGLETSTLEEAIEEFRGWAVRQSHLTVLEVEYRDVLADPWAASRRVTEFLGRELDVAAMAAAVEPELHREVDPGSPPPPHD